MKQETTTKERVDATLSKAKARLDKLRASLRGENVETVSRNTNEEFSETLTFGERVADKVATFGGSWTFIGLFAGTMLLWVILNSFLLVRQGNTFDPYPYILLNLCLSMLAAIQAPVIMMSQNRQAAKDRLDAENDYKVNLKAEIEILSLHEKLDNLREQKWSELIEMQQKQIHALTELLQQKNTAVTN
jgi:uncharacterized membrane protein